MFIPLYQRYRRKLTLFFVTTFQLSNLHTKKRFSRTEIDSQVQSPFLAENFSLVEIFRVIPSEIVGHGVDLFIITKVTVVL